MASHNDLGQFGEKIAAEYLEREDYQILETNWRHHRAEIDLIVQKEGILVFVEVKTRRGGQLEDIALAVDQHKIGLITHAAVEYQYQKNHEGEVRFDIISILYQSESTFDIQHFQDAFFPGL